MTEQVVYERGWNTALDYAERICNEASRRATPAAIAEKIRALRTDLTDEETA